MSKMKWSYLKKIFRREDTLTYTFKFRDILFFFKFVRPLVAYIFIAFVSIIILSSFNSLIPLSGKVLIDFIIFDRDFGVIESTLTSLHLELLISPVQYLLNSVDLLLIVIFVTALLLGTVKTIQNIMILQLQQQITLNVQTALFEQILRFPISYFKKTPVGYVMSRVTGDVQVIQNMFTRNMASILTNTFYFLFSMLIICKLNEKMSYLMLCMIPLYAWINWFFSTRIRGKSYIQREKQGDISKTIQETLSGIEVIKSHVTEEREVRKFADKIKETHRLNIEQGFLSAISNNFMRIINLASTLVIIWLCTKEAMNKNITIGDFSASILYFHYFTGRLNGFFSMILSLQSNMVSFQRLYELFKGVTEFDDHRHSKNLEKPGEIVGKIRFEGISFSYVEEGNVLEDVNFSIEPGEVVALTGASGVGKTTLINLILKFFIPQSGHIYIDDIDIGNLDTKWLRSKIGIVGQDIFIFNDTIENNIKYGNPSATMDEVINAAKKAHIHQEIMTFKEGYDTVIGERGGTLSIGQRQRISIARAFIRNPSLLILDEPTSSLDVETENRIKESLREVMKNRSTLIITHRLTLAEIADRVLFFKDRKVEVKSF